MPSGRQEGQAMNDQSLQNEGRAQAQSIEALLNALTAPFTDENTDADEIAEALEACGDSAPTQQSALNLPSHI